MLFVLVCRRCGGSTLKRSRLRNPFEWCLALIALPYRCRLCDYREFALRFALPSSHQELDAGAYDAPLQQAAPASPSPDQPAEAPNSKKPASTSSAVV